MGCLSKRAKKLPSYMHTLHVTRN